MTIIVVGNDVEMLFIQIFMVGDDHPEKHRIASKWRIFPRIPQAVGLSYSLIRALRLTMVDIPKGEDSCSECL